MPPHILGLGSKHGLYAAWRRDVQSDEAVLGRSTILLSIRRWLVRCELGLELGTGVKGGAAEEREDSTVGGEGFGNAGADGACGADYGAVFAGEAEGHDV